MGHWQFDLAGYVVSRLHALGLGQVAAPEHDTYADDAGFFSYRRSCHRNEPDLWQVYFRHRAVGLGAMPYLFWFVVALILGLMVSCVVA